MYVSVPSVYACTMYQHLCNASLTFPHFINISGASQKEMWPRLLTTFGGDLNLKSHLESLLALGLQAVQLKVLTHVSEDGGGRVRRNSNGVSPPGPLPHLPALHPPDMPFPVVQVGADITPLPPPHTQLPCSQSYATSASSGQRVRVLVGMWGLHPCLPGADRPGQGRIWQWAPKGPGGLRR